ncbi:MAG: hypothetical protein ABS88_00200 [Sphingopyxis sp. SCN 67-31]|nr:MAG: hypothetical protein ABS88_00200 [Sphingopyxis sp. SCN 67-31]
MTEIDNFVPAQATHFLFISKFPNAQGWVGVYQAVTLGMSEDGMQGAHRAGGGSFAATGDSASAGRSRPSSFPRCYIDLHLLDVGHPQQAHFPAAKKRANMTFDPASIHAQR